MIAVLIIGTIVLRMDTISGSDSVSAALFGKTKRAILALLFGHTDEAYYVREISRVAEVGLGAAQRELKRLSDAGIVRRTVRGHQVYYQANPDCPVFPELRGLVMKTAGGPDVLQAALAPLADRIRVACIYGSLATGAVQRGSDVDLLVVGDVAFGEIVAALGAAQEKLGREVNPTVYPLAEFQQKLAEGHHFLTRVVRGPKVFVIGDAHELARLAEQRLAE